MIHGNRVAIVTGASSGIGASIAVKLTEKGAKVALVGRNEAKLMNISEACSKLGHKPLTIVADVTKDEDAKRIISETIKIFGKLDILVNNAGIAKPASILAETAMHTFDEVLSTNLRACVHLTHLAASHLIETKGNIVNISSVSSQGVISKSSFSYCTSKAALDHFTRCIALELASKGVRVNSVNPGPVRTDLVENAGVKGDMVNHIYEEFKKFSPMGKIADRREIADLVSFLVSDKARSITGSSIVSDNGARLKGQIDALDLGFD